MSAAMTSRRLTRVQQDVVDRMKDGAFIDGDGVTFVLYQPGEPNRHVAWVTIHSLHMRGLIESSAGYQWFIA